MSTSSSSPAPFLLFAEKLDRNSVSEWRVELVPQLREGKVEWVTHIGGLQDPEVILNILRVTNGIVGDVGYLDSGKNTFRILFNALDPMPTGCSFQCNSITSFDNQEHTTHTMKFDLSKLGSFWPWRSAPPCAEISPDPYAVVTEETVDGRLTQRMLNLSSAARENWTEEYADSIVSSYPDVTRDGLYIITKSIAKSSPQPTTQQTMTFPMQVYTENLPAHMR